MKKNAGATSQGEINHYRPPYWAFRGLATTLFLLIALPSCSKTNSQPNSTESTDTNDEIVTSTESNSAPSDQNTDSETNTAGQKDTDMNDDTDLNDDTENDNNTNENVDSDGNDSDTEESDENDDSDENQDSEGVCKIIKTEKKNVLSPLFKSAIERWSQRRRECLKMDRILKQRAIKQEVIPLKKRVYRAVTIKKVDIERLNKFTSGNRIVFAVDAAKTDFYGAFLNENKESGLTIKWKSPDDVGLLLTLLDKLNASRLEVVLEPTGTYGDALREQLERQGIDVYLMSPKRCHDASEVYDGVPSSHDAKSAAIIGRLHLEGLSKPWPVKSEEQRRLSAALMMARVHRKQLHDNINRLEAQLARHWPELPRIVSLDSASLLGLLATYGGPRMVRCEQEKEVHRKLRQLGRSISFSKQQEIISSASATIGVTMIEPEEKSLRELALEIDRNRVALREFEKKVRQIMSESGQSAGVIEMSKTVGQITTAILLVTLGDPSSYESSGAYLKAAGLNLKERSSGTYKGCLKITKRGSGQVRQYLYLAVLRLIQSDPLIAKWYGHKVARDAGKKGKAIVALMRKLIIGLWRVGCDGTSFDSEKLFDEARLLKA